MLKLVIISAFIGVCYAHVEPILRQENAQNVNGQYNFGFNSETQTRNEVRGSDGITRGSYSYLDDQGIVRHIQYIAGPQGYYAYEADLPVTTATPEQASSTIRRVRPKHQQPSTPLELPETSSPLKYMTLEEIRETQESEDEPDTGVLRPAVRYPEIRLTPEQHLAALKAVLDTQTQAYRNTLSIINEARVNEANRPHFVSKSASKPIVQTKAVKVENAVRSDVSSNAKEQERRMMLAAVRALQKLLGDNFLQ